MRKRLVALLDVARDFARSIGIHYLIIGIEIPGGEFPYDGDDSPIGRTIESITRSVEEAVLDGGQVALPFITRLVLDDGTVLRGAMWPTRN